MIYSKTLVQSREEADSIGGQRWSHYTNIYNDVSLNVIQKQRK